MVLARGQQSSLQEESLVLNMLVTYLNSSVSTIAEEDCSSV